MSKDGYSGEFLAILTSDEHLEFVRAYLKARDIHFWETGRDETLHANPLGCRTRRCP